ncbi:AraC-like DNA-binding protein [Novosphingobium sp. SG751A]|uniref:helix-turn-helix domain-containing protein n=1 Tax=Novosphingobium sp. SG751A TaxID=2587000 RepID=UPI0015546146|nr:helix-turn-helix domain-containing protein [Novosphingobium sp. SG751A]NOW46418.1 AraC-like DNA-binding protein [Novosphingobium sp. SG751A]
MSTIEHFSTARIAANERLDFWNRLTNETYPGTLVDQRKDAFEAEMRRWSLGDLVMIRPRSCGSLVQRRPTGSAPEAVVLHVQHSGRSRHEQCGRVSELGVGDFVLSSANEPYRIDLRQHEFLVVEMPRAGLEARLPDLDAALSRRISGATPGSRLLHNFILSLWQQGDQGHSDAAWQQGVSNVFLDLLSLAVRDGQHPVQHCQPLREKIKTLVDANLGCAQFGSIEIAAELGVSVRTVQNAFAAMGTTPSAYILSRRLARACELLIVNPTTSVTAIAFDLGFSDSGYFARCFRAAYGATPSQWRGMQ